MWLVKGGMKERLILLTNDDGVHSVGLLAMRRALDSLGTVHIIAPEHERSGTGKAITCGASVKVKRVKLTDGFEAYAISGTPADAVMLSRSLLGRRPDLVVSGINLGPNIGVDDFLTSGTIGATIEAAIHGIPAIAVSYCIDVSRNAEEKRRVSIDELGPLAELAGKIAGCVLEHGMPSGVDIISINMPPGANPNRVRLTRLSYKGYGDLFAESREDGYCIPGWFMSMYPDDVEGTDIYAVRVEGAVSITPIGLSFNHNLEALRGFLRRLHLEG